MEGEIVEQGRHIGSGEHDAHGYPNLFLTVFTLQKWAIKKIDKLRRSFLWTGSDYNQNFYNQNDLDKEIESVEMSNGTYDRITLHIVPSDQARCLIFAKIFFYDHRGGSPP